MERCFDVIVSIGQGRRLPQPCVRTGWMTLPKRWITPRSAAFTWKKPLKSHNVRMSSSTVMNSAPPSPSGVCSPPGSFCSTQRRCAASIAAAERT